MFKFYIKYPKYLIAKWFYWYLMRVAVRWFNVDDFIHFSSKYVTNSTMEFSVRTGLIRKMVEIKKRGKDNE